jgi:hypothetical protein
MARGCFAIALALGLLAAFQGPLVAGTHVKTFSGGVGEEQRKGLGQNETYNVKLLFAASSGAYLSDVNVTLTDSSGAMVVQEVTKGPYLFVQLPQGSYRLKAKAESISKEMEIKAPGSGTRNYSLRFDVKE